jgi:hypothetical protein
MHSAYGTRLLSIGEIIDRAVHLAITNLLPLAAIIGLVDVPVRAITDWLDRDTWNRYFGALGKIVEDPRLLPYFFDLIRDPHATAVNWPFQLWIVASQFPLVLAFTAASIASLEFLKGESPRVGTAYRTAIRRLAPVIGATILVWALYIAGVVAVIIAALGLWFAWLLILKAGFGAFASTPVVVLTAGLVVTVGAAIGLITPLANCTFAGAALYVVRPIRALREGWTMTMSRGLRGRSLALGAAIIAIDMVQEIISSAVSGVLSNITHSPWLALVVRDALSLVALTFWTVLAVVFYLDARNRTGLIQDPLAERENSQAQ